MAEGDHRRHHGPRDSRSGPMIRKLPSLAVLDPKLVRAALHGSLPCGAGMQRLIDAPMG